MDTSNFPGVDLLIKYIHGEITKEELALLHKYMEESPVLKEKFDELSNPDKVRARFRAQYNFDKKATWEKFKKKHLSEYTPVEYTPVASTQLNWLQQFFNAAAVIPLIVCASFFAIVFILISNQSHQTEVQSETGLSAPETTELPAESGYLDLANGRRFNLDSIFQRLIDLSGSGIRSLDTMLAINNNNLERKNAGTIRIVTADKPIKVQLADGSEVIINKNSSFVLPLQFNSGQRTVGLLGEAYFDVKSNPHVPFIVQLKNNTEVMARGTTFTVHSSKKDCYTTLLRGHVTVTKNGKTQVLSEGEQVKITEDWQPFIVSKADQEKAIAWTRENRFEFRNIGFKKMMVEVGKWYGYEVYFEGEMPQKDIDIKLNEDVALDELLRSIEKEDNVKISKITADKKLIVTCK
jgi:hypothetical protein